MERVLQAMQDMIRPVRNAVALLVGRAVLAAVNDSGGLQRVQVVMLADEVHDNVERFQNYGLTSAPLSGAEAVALAAGGNRSHLVVVAMDDRRHRPKNLKPGEVMLYDHLGKYIRLAEDGFLEISAPKIRLLGSETIELYGAVTRVHSTERTIVECSGHGKELLPDRENTWTMGAVAGTANPINPPEIP